jgi:hypothetical protein
MWKKPEISTSSEIVADHWDIKSQKIETEFSRNSVIERKGVYTVVVILEDKDGNIFTTLSYSI